MTVYLNGKKVKALREGRLVTIQEAAKKIKKAGATIYNIESGKGVSIITARKYAAFLDVELETLVVAKPEAV